MTADVELVLDITVYILAASICELQKPTYHTVEMLVSSVHEIVGSGASL
jgi:hypothetical protein